MKKLRITLVLLFLAGAFMACTSPITEEQPKPDEYPNPDENTIYEQFDSLLYERSEYVSGHIAGEPCLIGKCDLCEEIEVCSMIYMFVADSDFTEGYSHRGYSWIDSIYGGITIHPTVVGSHQRDWIVDPNNNPKTYFSPIPSNTQLYPANYTYLCRIYIVLDIDEMKKVGGAAFRPYFYDSLTGKYYVGDICELEYRESADSANGFEIYIKYQSAN